MTDYNKTYFRLARRLFSVTGEEETAQALDLAAADLGVDLLVIFLAQEKDQALVPSQGGRAVMDRIITFLAEAVPGRLCPGDWQTLYQTDGPFGPLWQHQAFFTDSTKPLPGGVHLPLGTFLAQLLPAEAGFRPEMAADLAQAVGVESFCLRPLGREALFGAFLVGCGKERASDTPPDLVEELAGLLEPFLYRVHEHFNLQHLAEETDAAQSISHILARPRLSLQRRLDRCLKVILDALSSETGSIMLVKGRQLRVEAASNPTILGLTQSRDAETVAAHVWRSGKILNLEDVDKEAGFARHQDRLSNYTRNQVLCAPIFAGDKIVGVLNVTNRRDAQAFQRLEEGKVERFLHRIGTLLDRAAMTEALQDERRRLRKANQELKRLERFKHDLTNMVVHDLKGPLAEMVANISLMETETLSEMGREYLESAVLGADELTRMIGNLLDISRLEEGRLKLKLKTVDLAEAASEVTNRLGTLLALKSIEVENRLTSDRPKVVADPELIKRVFQNILANAVDHTPEEGLVVISAGVREKEVEISLADQGAGVPIEHREAIFEKFSQTPGRDKPPTSTGLGLTFCRLAVEAHHGRIWVQEAPGGGADFRFTLARAEEGE